MDPGATRTSERLAVSRALADLAVRGERNPERWRGYFERLLSGETIGPLPADAGNPQPSNHAISGQYALRLKVGPDDSPDANCVALQQVRALLARSGDRNIAIGIDLSLLPEERFCAWLNALLETMPGKGDDAQAGPATVLSLPAEHAGCRSLLRAVRDAGTAGIRAAFRVRSKIVGAGELWEELVEASHADRRIELVPAGDRQPLTDLMLTEKPDAIMPLSLFEAPADTAWLGLKFDLSTIPAEQIARGVGHLKKLVRVGVRLADNLIDTVTWPSAELRQDALDNRRLAAHVTGIGDLALRHGLDPTEFSTLRLVQRWLTLFKRQLLRESLRLAREREPYPALNARQLVRALAPRYGEPRARQIIARRSPRHRQLLALSPYCVLPRGPTALPVRAWLNLLPAIRIADNVTMYGSRVRSRLDRADYERLLRSTWALSGTESDA